MFKHTLRTGYPTVEVGAEERLCDSMQLARICHRSQRPKHEWNLQIARRLFFFWPTKVYWLHCTRAIWAGDITPLLSCWCSPATTIGFCGQSAITICLHAHPMSTRKSYLCTRRLLLFASGSHAWPKRQDAATFACAAEAGGCHMWPRDRGRGERMPQHEEIPESLLWGDAKNFLVENFISLLRWQKWTNLTFHLFLF